ncbi:PREDICTED: fractalkine [Propithecus coquereli]|uniref:fractalkine n=1 Tax=Propithecus coquereli TaxID=379532 RepID=UPI00063FB856|nr:PREDICTED: fractalkine [Propithecus coquereli]
MAPIPVSWLLRVAALCHLTVLLAGQHLGVTKCSITCNKMTSELPVNLLIGYQQNQESCGKRAIILETKRHRRFCADPKEKWVQEAMKHLDQASSQAAALTGNGGTFEKQIGAAEPRTTPGPRGMYEAAASEPEATGESRGLEMTPSSQEAHRALGTSPELPMGVSGSSVTRFPPTSKARDGGPEDTEMSTLAAVSTATAWQSSTASPPGTGLWAEEKTSEAPSTQAPTTWAPTLSHPALEENAGAEGQAVGTEGQSPRPENSLGPEEMDRVPAHTDAFRDWEPGSMAHVSVVPVSSEVTPSREPVASGSWAPKAEEPVHATVDPQRLSVLITPAPDPQAATRRQAVGLLAFLGLLFCLGVAMFTYQSLQGCPRKVAGEMVESLRYVPRSCGSNSYVLVPV